MNEELAEIINAMREKLKAARDEGPGAPDVVLTAEEATIAYRLLFEVRR